MELTKLRAEYEIKLQQVSKLKEAFIEEAVNYEDLLEAYGVKADIDDTELIFNDAKDMRYFENLQGTEWMLRQVLELMDEYIAVGDDNKNVHKAKKDLEELITSIRWIKKESKAVIEHEQQVISEVDTVLDLLDQIREK